MSIREFTDSLGVHWTVSLASPSSETTMDVDRGAGWLVFESQHSRRRLTPVPFEWENAPTHRLELWCRRAVVLSGGSGASAEAS